MIRQPRIEDLLYFFVPCQELSDESAVAVVLLHAYSQGSHSPKNQPAFERRENCSCGFLQERQLFSDGLGGVVVCTKREQAEKLAFLQKAAGAILSPFECWLVLRGVRTLAVRMEQHDRNGRFVAEFLARHKKVKQVFYPGLPDHPQYELAQQQMSGFGSMITFETGSLSNAKKMLRKVRLCSLAESLGGVETLISHPATMTHGAIGEKGRKDIGITDGMVRISVGIENVEDIMDDLDQALAAI